MRTREQEVEPLINLSEITEIELRILRRMREFTIGEHSSLFHGAGFDFVGLRDWQAGDRFEAIDWPQSTLTNFCPLIVREFEQPSTSSVIVLADRSASTRCGLDGLPIATVIARAIATIGMSAVFFQDSFGLITFDRDFDRMAALRPRMGKGHIIHCLDAYQRATGLQDLRQIGSLSATVTGFMRKTSLVTVVSDFLIEDPAAVLRELALIDSVHDVFITIVDASFAFEMPRLSAGWIEAFDVESGRARVMSRRQVARLASRTAQWQDEVARQAKEQGLDVVRLGRDQTQFDIAWLEWVAERRLRRR
ncbi:MAG: DUF58 domain-containing protein [Acidobacteria bacterium]|nr:DUF58 domain-containing protein [Acidobacteriota bacterium]